MRKIFLLPEVIVQYQDIRWNYSNEQQTIREEKMTDRDKEIKEMGDKILKKYFKKENPNDSGALRCAICKKLRKDTTPTSIIGQTKQVCPECLVRLKVEWECTNDGYCGFNDE